MYRGGTIDPPRAPCKTTHQNSSERHCRDIIDELRLFDTKRFVTELLAMLRTIGRNACSRTSRSGLLPGNGCLVERVKHLLSDVETLDLAAESLQ